jgi:hypothetical protein
MHDAVDRFFHGTLPSMLEPNSPREQKFRLGVFKGEIKGRIANGHVNPLFEMRKTACPISRVERQDRVSMHLVHRSDQGGRREVGGQPAGWCRRARIFGGPAAHINLRLIDISASVGRAAET